MSSEGSGSRDGGKKGRNKRPVTKVEEEKTEELCESISLQQTGGKPNERLVEEFTRAFQSATVKRIGVEIQVQRSTSTKKTVVERGRLDTIPENS